MLPSIDVFFSLGEAVAVLGIIIAVYGIIRPRWRLNFELNRRFLFSVFVLLVLGFVTALTGFILAAYTPYGKISLTFQGATYLLFLFAGIDFARGAFWKKPLFRHKFSEKRKGRFVQRILDEALLAKDDETLNAIITIVRDSLHEACLDIKNAAVRGSVRENAGAYLLNTFLGESRVANYVAENRLDFIEVLILSIDEHKLRGVDASIGVDSLLDALYTNPKSYFYQQIGYDGLTNYASAYRAVFENEFFLREHNPVAAWYNVGQRVNFRSEIEGNSQFVKVFLKGYEMALQKFAYTHPSLSRELSAGMRGLGEYAESASRATRKLTDYDYFSPAAQAFHEILHFVSHTFYFEVFQKKASHNQIPDEELTPPLESEEYREGLSSAFCRLFTSLAESIVVMHDKDEYERMDILQLNEIFVSSIGSYSHIQGMRAKILHMLWQKSEENIRRGSFPVVFRALAIMLYWKHNNMPAWAITERNKLIDTLREDIKPRILRNETMINRNRTPKEEALLPSSIIFDKTTGKFYSVDYHGNRTELRKTQ